MEFRNNFKSVKFDVSVTSSRKLLDIANDP